MSLGKFGYTFQKPKHIIIWFSNFIMDIYSNNSQYLLRAISTILNALRVFVNLILHQHWGRNYDSYFPVWKWKHRAAGELETQSVNVPKCLSPSNSNRSWSLESRKILRLEHWVPQRLGEVDVWWGGWGWMSLSCTYTWLVHEHFEDRWEGAWLIQSPGVLELYWNTDCHCRTWFMKCFVAPVV